MGKLISLFVALLLVVLAGCATLRGIAEDTENLGKGLKKTISENDSSKKERIEASKESSPKKSE